MTRLLSWVIGECNYLWCGIANKLIFLSMTSPCDNYSTSHQCSGGVKNILYTFGGSWHEDDRMNLDNWVNNPNIVDGISIEPKRVPHTLYEFISTRNCVSPPDDDEIPQVDCSNDEDCFDGRSCTTDTCDVLTGTCSNKVSSSCLYGKFIQQLTCLLGDTLTMPNLISHCFRLVLHSYQFYNLLSVVRAIVSYLAGSW